MSITITELTFNSEEFIGKNTQPEMVFLAANLRWGKTLTTTLAICLHHNSSSFQPLICTGDGLHGIGRKTSQLEFIPTISMPSGSLY